MRGLIVRDRELALLSCLDDLPSADGSACLEIGRECSDITFATARKKLNVILQVRLPAIAARARAQVIESGFGGNISVLTGQASTMAYRDESFDLVTAVHIFPWDPAPSPTLDEIRRILKPGGHFITMFQNRWRLSRLFDPRLTPFLAPHLIRLKRSLEKVRGMDVRVESSIPVNHSAGEIQMILARKGLTIVDGRSAGFGEFSILGKRIFSDRWGRKIHSLIQRLANARFPLVWRTGSYYIIRARKDDRGLRG